MKTTEGYHVDTIQCNCPYCSEELIFHDHEFCALTHMVSQKSTREKCHKCGKTFWLKKEE